MTATAVETGGWIRFVGGPMHNCHLWYPRWYKLVILPTAWQSDSGKVYHRAEYKLVNFVVYADRSEQVVELAFYEYHLKGLPNKSHISGSDMAGIELPRDMSRELINKLFNVARANRMPIRKTVFCWHCWEEHPI